MASTNPVRILTVGSAVGQIRDLFAKVKAIDAKHGKFDFVLCIGDFFGPLKAEGETDKENETNLLLSGKLEAPVECYIMQGGHPLPDKVIEQFSKTGGELCKNVFLLSKSGMVTTAHGLRVACLGGIYEPEIYSSAEVAPGFASPFFSMQTTEKLLSNAMTMSDPKSQNYSSLAAIHSTSSSSQLIDILISNVWPSSITQHSSIPLPSFEPSYPGAPPLDDVIRRTKPRYHFAAGGGQPPSFWEREPFIWDTEVGRTTRFVSLGAFGEVPTDGKKQRWFYAFSISPSTAISGPPAGPVNATKNPFTESPSKATKRTFESEGDNYIFGNVKYPGKRGRTDQREPGKPPPGYKCKRCDSTEHFINDCPERIKPPEGYVCRICNTPGHLVRDCPTRHAVGDTGGRKPKEGYVCRACGSELHYLDDCPIVNQRHSSHADKHGRRMPPKEIGPDECWFCLSNPGLAKHLIVSIGTECYLTLPKGQIISTQSSVDHVAVPGGGHVLIVPISHYPTLSTIPPELASPILDEIDRLKSALRALYAKHGCAAVLFEVGRISGKGGHAHIQAVPIPFNLMNKVKDTFINEGRVQGIDFASDPEEALASCAGGRGGYFRVDLPDGSMLVHLMKDTVPFNLQFGRQVLVSLLGIPERMDWRACMLSDDEDKADALAFKLAFGPFDPST